MGELLEGGKQIICDGFDELREKVYYALDHPELGEMGFEFARQFTAKKFNEEWLSLIEKVSEKG